MIPTVPAGARPRILDGGHGTEVAARGWSIEHPLWGSRVLLTPEGRALDRAIHADYRDAGADVLIAATHNLSLSHVERFLERAGWSSEVDHELSGALDAAGASRARRLLEVLHQRAREDLEASRSGALAVGCLASPEPPYAREPHLTPAEAGAAFRPQWEALLRQRFDGIAFEMLSTPSDVRAAADLVARTPSRPPISFGLVFGPDGRLLSGLRPDQVLDLAAPARPEMWCVQCTMPEGVDRALEGLRRAAPDVVLGVYANGAGLSPRDYAEQAKAWSRHGVLVLGGCCGTTPDHIRALRADLASPSTRGTLKS